MNYSDASNREFLTVFLNTEQLNELFVLFLSYEVYTCTGQCASCNCQNIHPWHIAGLDCRFRRGNKFYCLPFILDILMVSDLYPVHIIEFLKDNDILAAKFSSIECKFYRYLAVSFLCGKRLCSCDFLSLMISAFPVLLSISVPTTA